MKAPESYTLTLRPQPGNWQTPPEQRLRAALKRLLRNYGLRCIKCQPTAPDEAEPQAPEHRKDCDHES
jgi:sugar phosphate isomerase/epimerase